MNLEPSARVPSIRPLLRKTSTSVMSPALSLRSNSLVLSFVARLPLFRIPATAQMAAIPISK